MRQFNKGNPAREEIFETMRDRLNAMTTPEDQEDYLTMLLRVTAGFWTYRAKDRELPVKRLCLHELGAVLHGIMLDNRDQLGIADPVKVRVSYLGGHAHFTVYINGALSGTLVTRLTETDVIGRLLAGIEVEEVANDGEAEQ